MTSSPRFSEDAPRLGADALKARLADIFYLDVVSGRNYERLFDALALQPRAKQEFALHWGKVAARSDVEIGYLAIQLAPAALKALTTAQAERWVIAALDAYDREGLRAAVAALRDIAAVARETGVLHIDSVEARLTRFLQGLSGRPLRIAGGDAGAWTDTATMHLPRAVAGVGAFDRHKALAALLWAQTRYGSFRDDLEAVLAAQGDAARAAAWLALLETLRLAARLTRELPGLAQALQALLAQMPPMPDAAHSDLARTTATLDDSLAWLPRLMPQAPPADAPFGALRPALALQVRASRVAQDTLVLRKAVAGLMAAMGKGGGGESEIALQIDAAAGEMTIDGEVVALPPDGAAAAQSLQLDLGAIPPECLTPAGPGEWQPTQRRGDGPLATLETQADAVYDEWDYNRRSYRRDWCHVFLREVPAGDADYVANVKRRHAPLIRRIRRRFEALRGEERVLRRQADGPEIDLDALVAAIADRRGGAEASERVFMRRQRDERALAAMFMVDMSGSTSGWVNEAEREALVMLCEALEALGDRYAIWGFSGWTRTRCELYRIKDFADRYDEAVCRRIAAVEAKDYTRMGPPIRHLTQLLLRQPARHRLLVTLSDGRPDDFGDEYRGHYGIEDTRQALVEARQQGVRSYCVTIDRHGADYLKHMYGAASYTVLDDVRKLPLQVAEIYRKLAT
ncbi:MAG: VWA domain-containing protein [Rhodocyclales bacterium]|nr:VWA domain-containing protein [Rhodocyclales bacterium]